MRKGEKNLKKLCRRLASEGRLKMKVKRKKRLNLICFKTFQNNVVLGTQAVRADWG